jgi:hypothetical protein
MHTRILFILTMILICLKAYAQQQHQYPLEDFYHHNISIPIDHPNNVSDNFSLYYELSSNFKFEQPTIFFITDQQQAELWF